MTSGRLAATSWEVAATSGRLVTMTSGLVGKRFGLMAKGAGFLGKRSGWGVMGRDFAVPYGGKRTTSWELAAKIFATASFFRPA